MGYILAKLLNLVGSYCLYEQEGSQFGQDPRYVKESYMQQQVFNFFGRARETLLESVKCEDYEEEGILEFAQLQEAISSVDEELDVSVLDYMLYYVLVRSENID